MIPQTTTIAEETPEEQRFREQQFIRQVEDHSLPARQVLTDQQDGPARDELPAVFVP